MVRLTLLILIALGAGQPAPATRTNASDKLTTDFKTLLQKVPQDCRPKRGDKWRSVHVGLCRDWLNEHLGGASIKGKAVFASVLVSHSPATDQGPAFDTFTIEATQPGFTMLGLSLEEIRISVRDAKIDKATVSELKQGDAITIDGAITHAELYEDSVNGAVNTVSPQLTLAKGSVASVRARRK